jgi:hypothetical protein
MSAVQTLVVPRATPMLLSRWVFRGVRVPFTIRHRYAKDYVEQERAMALRGPLGLLGLAVAWLVLIGSGYVLMYWALGVRPLRHAFVLSGSSMFTLGFVVPENLPTTTLAFTQAAFGIGVIAMLISAPRGWQPPRWCAGFVQVRRDSDRGWQRAEASAGNRLPVG